MKTKYIIVKDDFGAPAVVILDKLLSHDKVAAGKEVLSAGFVEIWPDGTEIKAICYGESISLHIKSRPEKDTELLTKMFQSKWAY